MSKLSDLEKLADAATPGKWESSVTKFVIAENNDSPAWLVARCLEDCNARFIAACDPQTVKQMVVLIRQADAAMRDFDYDKRMAAIAAIEAFERGEP